MLAILSRSALTDVHSTRRSLMRMWIAAVTVLAFITLLATAASHHHRTAVEDRDCAVCSTAAHKVPELTVAIALPPVVFQFFYPTVPFVARKAVYAAFPFIPPTRGPPMAS